MRCISFESLSKESSHLFDDQSEWSQSLHPRIIQALSSKHFQLEKPTLIQSRALQAFSADTNSNNNILLQSETGSGKTLAYLLPILQQLGVNLDGSLNKIDRSAGGTRCVILCPTRELALQTMHVLERLCANTFGWIIPGCLFGEEKRKSEKARIRKGISILVATPGRLLDHLTRTDALLISLKGKLKWLVLDEADRLMDMGLGEQVKQIVQRIQANQSGAGVTWRSVLVSATVPPSVETMAKETLIGGDNEWVWVKATNTEVNATNESVSLKAELSESAPDLE